MVLRLTERQQQALARDYQDRLGARIASWAGREREAPRYRDYVQEAVASGVTGEDDIADLAMLLDEIDGQGRRPRDVLARLADPEVKGALKVFQVGYAWSGSRRRLAA